jgi:hypothetical protein
MHSPRTARPLIAGALAAAALSAGVPAAVAAAPHRHGGPGGGEAPAATTARRLPANWPKDVPVPPGSVQGTNITAAHAVVQLIVNGSAAQAMRSTTRFYRLRGFTGAGATLHRGTRRVTIVVENRDHSNAHTFVVIDAFRR